MCQNCFLSYDIKNQWVKFEKHKMVSAGFVFVSGGINNLKKSTHRKIQIDQLLNKITFKGS